MTRVDCSPIGRTEPVNPRCLYQLHQCIHHLREAREALECGDISMVIFSHSFARVYAHTLYMEMLCRPRLERRLTALVNHEVSSAAHRMRVVGASK